jgi:hypothetical protein
MRTTNERGRERKDARKIKWHKRTHTVTENDESTPETMEGSLKDKEKIQIHNHIAKKARIK